MDLHDMPRTITKKLYVTLGVGRFNFNDINVLSFDSTKYMSDGHEEILLLETVITLDLPKKISGKDHFINLLKKKKKGIEDEYHMNLEKVQDQIDRLLDTEHKRTTK